MPKSQEIERVFKVRRMPGEIARCPSEEIVQGYLAIDSNGSEVRLRKIGDQYCETFKGGGLLQRRELEVSLTKDQFNALWPATEGRRLEKKRYKIAHAGKTIELNVYRGNLEGLVLAEIEFASLKKSEQFQPPDWLGEEVTEDSRFKNQNLAQNGAPAGAIMRSQ